MIDLERVKCELFLELLMRLFADPACFDSPRQLLERSVRGQIAEVSFTLATGAMLTDKPDFFAVQVLLAKSPDALWRTIGNPDPHRGKSCRQSPLGAAPPADGAPGCGLQGRLGRAG